MGSKKKTTQTTNQTQTAAPPSFTAPGLTSTANQVTAALNSLDNNYYQGDFFARPDQDISQQIIDSFQNTANLAGETAQAQQTQFDALNNLNFNLADSAQRAGVNFDFGDQQLGPTEFQAGDGEARLNAAIEAAMNPVYERLEEQVLPGIRSSALASGAYGNSRAYATLPGQAIEDANESAQRIAAEIAYQGFQADENRRLDAYNIFENNLIDSFNAQTQRGLGQAGIDASLAAGDADRNLRAAEQEAMLELERIGLSPQLLNNIMMLNASQGDLLGRAQEQDLYERQIDIDNALARDDYDVTRPFRGLDIATQLLSQLSGGYGTQTLDGTTRTVEKSGGGLGGIVQGALGLGGLAASFIPGVGQVAAPAVAAAAGSGSSSRTPAASLFSNWNLPGYGRNRP